MANRKIRGPQKPMGGATSKESKAPAGQIRSYPAMIKAMRDIIPADVKFKYCSVDLAPQRLHSSFTGDPKLINRLWHDLYFAPLEVVSMCYPYPKLKSGGTHYKIVFLVEYQLAYFYIVYTIMRQVFTAPAAYDQFADSIQERLPKVVTLNSWDLGNPSDEERKIHLSIIGTIGWARAFHRALENIGTSMGDHILETHPDSIEAPRGQGPVDANWCRLDLTMSHTKNNIFMLKDTIERMTYGH